MSPAGSVGIDLGGSALPPALAACLSDVEVRQALNAPSLAILTFLDPPDTASGPIGIGAELNVRAPDGTELFSGEVTGIGRSLNGARERSVTIRAYDALHRLRKKQSLRTLSDTSLADLAASLGLTVSGPGLPEARSVIVQHAQSDFELLAELAGDAGLCFWLDQRELRLFSLGGDGDDPLHLKTGEQILEIASDVSAEPMRKSSHAAGWDLGSNHVIESSCGSAAQDALEMRMDAMAAFEGLGDRYLVNRLGSSDDDVKRVAQADMDRATARGLRLDTLCEGDPALRPGRVVEIEGLGPETDGPFVITGTTHSFDAAAGYTTRFATDPPPPAPRSARSPSVSLAIVTDTDDPASRARVKARFPLFGDIVGDWMPVLSLGAGKTKGFTVIPEPGDEVLVMMPDGDPARGIVLGGLYGSNAAPGERPASGPRAFVVRSPSGPQLTFDGERALVRLESGGGEILEIGPDGTLLRAMRDMTIEAPGHLLKIRAARVEFEQA